jgi:hypothetical protein
MVEPLAVFLEELVAEPQREIDLGLIPHVAEQVGEAFGGRNFLTHPRQADDAVIVHERIDNRVFLRLVRQSVVTYGSQHDSPTYQTEWSHVSCTALGNLKSAPHRKRMEFFSLAVKAGEVT